jgi:hypothetical protein
MIEIYVDQISERLVYTLDFVFRERGLEYKLNNDYLSFQNSTNYKLNYSERFFESIPQCIPARILFDEEIINYSLDIGLFNEEDECLSFDKVVDPLGSIFYVLSRMEEYLDFRQDPHGRFAASFSIQTKYKWLNRAICDRWSVAFIDYLAIKLSIEIKLPLPEIRIRPTFDIDNVYAYQWKQGIRRLFSILRDQIKGNKRRIRERKLVESKLAKDPYDTYEYIEYLFDRGYDVNIFWLVGDYAQYDKNVSCSDIRHQQLIRTMADRSVIGLHPSYKSNTHHTLLAQEKERLERITGISIENTRQHFLKLKVRSTYKKLIELGFKHDFSMGYADQVGFRSGTARPHFWFDLSQNQISPLTIHPFVYMDGTLNEYLRLSVNDSKQVIDKLYSEVSRFGGEFICIWHNETIGDYGIWEGWREVLEHTLNLKKQNG